MMTGPAILARDMMTHKLITLSPDMDVFVAIEVLLKKRISGAPVVDVDGTFVGIFSERSCMKFIVDSAYDNLPGTTLRAFVDTQPPCISPETDLLTICQTFLNQATRRLPVIDEQGKLVGQISRRDAMRKVMQCHQTQRRQSTPEPLYLSAVVEDSQSVVARML